MYIGGSNLNLKYIQVYYIKIIEPMREVQVM